MSSAPVDCVVQHHSALRVCISSRHKAGHDRSASIQQSVHKHQILSDARRFWAADVCAIDAGKDCTDVVKKAFEKTLAIAKVGMECKLKASELAQKNSDANTHFFLGCFAEQQVRASESVVTPDTPKCHARRALQKPSQRPLSTVGCPGCSWEQAAPQAISDNLACLFLGYFAEQKVPTGASPVSQQP